jgi:hypothetical protein
VENIALIKEVHQHLSIKKAEEEAYNELKKISLEHIAKLRKNKCTKKELFYAMVIRAFMSSNKKVIIEKPLQLSENIKDINEIIKNIEILNTHKDIIILDLNVNKHRYKGCKCNTIK